jgi:tRNA pseudouridine13 synthase
VELRLATIDRLVEGDLAWKHFNGACFLVENAATEAHRAESFEISASGPMFGSRMKQPAGSVLVLEQDILAHEGLCPDDFDHGSGVRVEGERRPLRVPLEAAACRVENNLLIVEFSLPKGSYATSGVREITKAF